MKISLLGLCLLMSVTVYGQSVTAVLERMDKAAPEFHGVSADLQMDSYTAILSDTSVDTGTLQMQRLGTNNVRAIIDLKSSNPSGKTQGSQDAREMGFTGKDVTIYYPKLNVYTVYPAGKSYGSNVLNQFLLLGFGSSGKELQQSYEISGEGLEKVAGQDTTKLLLVPRNAKILEHLTKIEIWVPNGDAYPVRQQFYEPSGNYKKVTYSNIKINPSLPSRLELNLPSDAKKQSQ